MATPRRARAALLALAGAAAIATSVAVAAAGGDQRGAQPVRWSQATIADGAATLFYPASWRAVAGDSGTVSFALRDQHGLYLGYLNLTPREGAEQLRGWAAFRAGRNSEEGDRAVRIVASSERVGFAAARGSCVIDDYTSSVGSHRYRELACIVAGRHSTSVFVGAALRPDWTRLASLIRHAAATLVER